MRYIEESAAHEMFNEALDCEGAVTVAGMEFLPSRILAEVDPIAYRCGFIDWADAEEITTDESEADHEGDDLDTTVQRIEALHAEAGTPIADFTDSRKPGDLDDLCKTLGITLEQAQEAQEALSE